VLFEARGRDFCGVITTAGWGFIFKRVGVCAGGYSFLPRGRAWVVWFAQGVKSSVRGKVRRGRLSPVLSRVLGKRQCGGEKRLFGFNGRGCQTNCVIIFFTVVFLSVVGKTSSVRFCSYKCKCVFENCAWRILEI